MGKSGDTLTHTHRNPNPQPWVWVFNGSSKSYPYPYPYKPLPRVSGGSKKILPRGLVGQTHGGYTRGKTFITLFTHKVQVHGRAATGARTQALTASGGCRQRHGKSQLSKKRESMMMILTRKHVSAVIDSAYMTWATCSATSLSALCLPSRVERTALGSRACLDRGADERRGHGVGMQPG